MKPLKGDAGNLCRPFRAQYSIVSWNPGFQSPRSRTLSPWALLHGALSARNIILTNRRYITCNPIVRGR